MEASALRAPAGLRERARPPVLLRLRSDDQLVALFRLGNEDAFRAIHDRYRTRLLAYTRQMLGASRADAEDALQDVFLRAYGALRMDDRPVTLRAWLYRVAHNRCIDHLRRGLDRPGAEDVAGDLHSPADGGRDSFHAVQQREDLRRLVADVQRLPEQQRSALLMREMEGLTYQELADALQVTLPAVKSLLVRARMGLVEAQVARDTACAEIRTDLAGAHDRGVRANARARRHLRECAGCRDYRDGLRGLERGIAALTPSPGPWATLAKLFGIGGSGAGAAAGGGAALGGGTVAGGAAVATTAKVAAVVCCAAIVGGSAVEVSHRSAGTAPVRSGHAAASPSSSRSGAVIVRALAPVAAAAAHPLPREVREGRMPGAARRHRAAGVHPAVPMTAPPPAEALDGVSGAADGGDEADHVAQAAAGGVLAPDEDAAADDTGAGATEGDSARASEDGAVAGTSTSSPSSSSSSASGATATPSADASSAPIGTTPPSGTPGSTPAPGPGATAAP